MVKVSLLELQRSRPRVASMAEVSQLSKIGFERVEIKFWMARAILTLCASVPSGAKEKIEKKTPPDLLRRQVRCSFGNSKLTTDT